MIVCWNCRLEVADLSSSIMTEFEEHMLCPECLIQQKFSAAGFDIFDHDLVLKCPTDPIHSFVVVYLADEDTWTGRLRIDATGETDGGVTEYDGWDFAFSAALGLGFTEPVLEK